MASGKTNLCTRSAFKPLQYIQLVRAFRRGGQPEQNARSNMVKQSTVTRSSRVVEFVNDNVFKRIPRPLRKVAGVVALDRTEEVSLLVRITTTDQQVAEILVPQDTTKRTERLPQDFLAVGDEQQRRFHTCLATDAGVVEGRNHSLARTGCRYDQVSVFVLDFSLGREERPEFPLETDMVAGRM
jgi:hypothetical protein